MVTRDAVMIEACGNTEVIFIYCMFVFWKKKKESRQLETKGTGIPKLYGQEDKSQLIKGSGGDRGD